MLPNVQRMTASVVPVIAALHLLLNSACGGGGAGGGEDTPPRDTSKRICAEGGVVSASGVTLTIPPGALTECQPITLTVGGTRPVGYDVYSQLVTAAPQTLTLAVPATITIPFTGDVAKARLFWSLPDSVGYARRSEAPSGTRISAQLDRLGSGFVADGVVYAEQPDVNCVKTKLIEGRTTAPSNVALFFTVDDCQGRPVTGLTCDSYPSMCNFVLKENGLDLSSEASAVVRQRDGVEVFVSLVIDLSSSTSGNLPAVIAGAKAFVRKLQVDLGLRVQVSIQLFAGEPKLTEWQPPTLYTATLESRLDALPTFAPADPSSTNLNGAVIAALQRQAGAMADFEARNYGGAFTAGYVVIFTDGRDTAHRATAADVLAAEETYKDDVLGVALASPDLDLGALQLIAPSGVLVASSGAALLQDFEALAASRIAGQIERTYLLGYCSPARSGTNIVSVEVNGATSMATASYQFPATGFTPGCSTSTIVHQCDGLQCGGFGCGACDDRTGICDAASSQCVDPCVASGQAFCGGGCFDLLTDEASCGSCGSVCARGFTCTTGACTCAAPRTVCAGACSDTSTDDTNCGGCGNPCAAGSLCVGAACVDGCVGRRTFEEVGSQSFAVPSTVVNVRSVAMADLNGDGRPDFAATHFTYNTNTVSVLVDGRRRDYAVGASPFSVAIGDLNGDEKADLAVANWGSNSVSVLLGNGDGTFRPRVDYGTGSGPASVAIGDLNWDRKADLAVANSSSNTVSVLLGNGDGTFQAKVDHPVGASPRSVVIHDLNGDRKADLAVANSGSVSVSVLLGNWNGTFRPKVDYATDVSPVSLAIGDLNGDGIADLAVNNSVLLGNGDGTFQPRRLYLAGSGANGIAVGDLNGDGKADLAVAVSNVYANTLSVLHGNGDGTFQPKVDYATRRGPTSVAIGDWDGDRMADLVVAANGDWTSSTNHASITWMRAVCSP